MARDRPGYLEILLAVIAGWCPCQAVKPRSLTEAERKLLTAVVLRTSLN
jgi:hypothetical protein